MANEYRVSQFAAEVLHDGAPAVRLSQFGVEVLHAGQPAARISSFAIEVLRSTDSLTTGRRRQMIVT